MTELRYTPLMKMQHENAHITLDKQDVCLGFSNKGSKETFKDGNETRLTVTRGDGRGG